MHSRFRRFSIAAAPGLGILIVGLAITLALGGPIAGVLAGAFLFSALVVSCLAVGMVVVFTRLMSSGLLIVTGMVTYLLAAALVLLLWTLYGPSQIM